MLFFLIKCGSFSLFRFLKKYICTFILLIVFGLLLSPKAYSQSYQFEKYNVEDGLPQQYIYSLNQDNNGFIWVGTGDGISKFDGIEFKNYTVADGMAENFVTCSAQKQANTIWLGHNKGGISKIVNGEIYSVIPDTLLETKITDIVIDSDNYVWATSQDGFLIKINPKLEYKKFDLFSNKKNIYSIAGRVEDKILIGTDDGLYLWSLDTKMEPTKFEKIEYLKQNKISCITASKQISNNFWVGTAEAGLYQLKFEEGKFKSRHFDDVNINSSNIQDIEEDVHNNLWISSYEGLYKLIYNKEIKGLKKAVRFGEENGIGNYITTTILDQEGNAWIGMYGDGLAMLKDEIFTFHSNSDDESIPNDTRCFVEIENVKWYGLSNGLLKIDSNGEKTYFNSKNGFKDVAVSSILDAGIGLYIGTDGEGLFTFNFKSEKFLKQHLITSYLANSINKLLGNSNDLWVASEGGLIKKNIITGKTQVYNTLRGLKHNSVYDVIMLKDGSVVLGSHSNELTIIKNDQLSHIRIADMDQPMDIVSMELDKDNNLWLATLGNGVFKQENDSFIQVSIDDGLKSDYCYSIVSDDKNGVWVGHRGGLSRISKETFEVQVFDSKNGITNDFNQGATFIDSEKNIWFGTNEKVLKFNSKKFLKNTSPPVVSIKNLYISDTKVPIENQMILPYSSYKLKIDFIGISFKQPEGVKYQYYLEGYDLEWSESSILNTATYPRIDDGLYTFYVKACNIDGYCSEETLAFQIEISAPIWKKWWFWLIILFLVAFIIIFIVKKREANQKEIQKRLEVELEKRTKEVVKKSDEIEEKNNSITDSINYALRIQKSILPSKSLMKKYYPESFVFYRPRDIVSGDFYWYEKIGSKFMVVCADCTGHGVPGAFMSMIASTLFKEIAHQYKITDPSKFLYKLDSLLDSTLKKSKNSRIHDGLDLSICVFDVETNHLSFSGAYRPILLFSDGELKRIKTSSFSIGGDDFMEKEFKTSEVQLNKGDIVYLFSDGYPDQFGGERGKKLYLKGFETLIKNSLDLRMDKQQEMLKKHLNEWKGDAKQVDDILVMGVKIV
jgi:ligand-binding sensor domain-containing protein/serine phosphatase RsbU (regulator of sigma subunit)